MMRERTHEATAHRLHASETGEEGRPALVWEVPMAGPDAAGDRVAARLDLLRDHPNRRLARPLAHERDGDLGRLVMEHPAGVRLSRLIRMGRMRVDQFLDFAVQAVEAVEILHNRRIAHGHLSPKAIFVHVERRALQLALHRDCLTRPEGQAAGIEGRDVADLLYCAPEQSGRTETAPDLRAISTRWA